MRPPRFGPMAAVLALSLLFLVPMGTTAAPLANSGSFGGAHRSTAFGGPFDVPVGRSVHVAERAATPSGSRAAVGPYTASMCQALRARAPGLLAGPPFPPAVSYLDQAAPFCPISVDEAGLGLISGAPASGARAQLSLGLPPAAGGAGRAMSAYEVGLWVQGVPCSVGGASYLAVEFVPPYGAGAASNASNWTVYAPIYDLASAGSCDPLCQNQTALYTFFQPGRFFCEDDIVLRGPASGTGPVASVAPGSNVTLALVGAAGGAGPLAIYLNETAPRTVRWAWNYTDAFTTSGPPITPASNTSTAGSGAFWTAGPSLSVRALLCPSAAPGVAPGTCSSYDGPRMNASLLPRLLVADSWNATRGSYSDPYGAVAPFSSSGACGGAAAPCSAFRVGGGTGNYPYFHLDGANGNASWGFGGNASTSASPFGGAAQFPSNGNASLPMPAAAISAIRTTASVAGVSSAARLTSTAGIRSAALQAYFCPTGPTAQLLTVPATESPSPGNGPTDGAFSATTLFTAGEHGRVVSWWILNTSTGGRIRSPDRVITVGGGAPICADPTPPTPWFGPANVTAGDGGYRLDFAENSSAIANYSLTLRPVPSGPVVTAVLNGTGPVFVPVPAGTGSWNLTLVAVDPDGNRSVASPVVAAGPVLAPLGLGLSGVPSGEWLPSSPVPVDLAAFGGLAPYRFTVSAGGGAPTVSIRSSPFWNLTVDLAGFSGTAWVRATVVDATGAAANATPAPATIVSGPFGINQTLSAGSYDVHLAWSSPVSPAAPVSSYTVYYTNVSGAAPTLAGLGLVNRSGAGVYLWNTTQTSFDLPNVNVGATYWMLVVGWNAFGEGLLPSGWLKSPSATTANLSYQPMAFTPVGGPAPLTVGVSDEVSLGTNGTLTEALYDFVGEGTAPANLSSNLSGSMAYWWLNASWSFATSGLKLVTLHVTDAYADTQIPIGSVYVGPAGPPSAVARVTSGVAIAGQPVSFDGIAGGGTGSYAYNWSFGDGGNSSALAPVHTYFASGNYTAVLQVTDTGDGESVFAEANLTVYALPTAAITASANASGSSFNFTARVSGGVGNLAYSWNFGDGTVGGGAAVAHAYGQPGRYTVNLTVTDALRHTTTASVSVLVPASPTAPAAPNTGLTGPELAAFAVLSALVVVLLIGLVYFWSKSRSGTGGTASSAPPEPPRVRAPPPQDPPDPS